MYIIEKAVVKMIRDRSFYAYLVQNCILHVTNEVPTAGVNVYKGKLNLYINPKFWDKIGEDFGVIGQAKILEHEMMHIALGHLFRHVDQKTEKGSITHSAVNVSMDCAINQYLSDLPTGFVSFDKEGNPVLDKDGNVAKGSPITFDNFKEMLEQNQVDTTELERKREFEHYYSFIKNNIDKFPSPQALEGAGDLVDDHDMMRKGDQDKELIKDASKEAMKKALDSAKAAGVGNLDHIENIMNSVYKEESNWKAILNQFIGNSCDILKEQTRKKRHRRYGVTQPGEKTLPKLNLLFCNDTSGSVGQKEKEAFTQHLNSIVDDRFDITVVDGDSDITQVRKHTKKTNNVQFKGGGGTSYKPFFDYAKAHKADAIIIVGDGYCFDTDKLHKPNIPVLWAITEGGQFPVEWGMKLTIKLPNT